MSKRGPTSRTQKIERAGFFGRNKIITQTVPLQEIVVPKNVPRRIAKTVVPEFLVEGPFKTQDISIALLFTNVSLSRVVHDSHYRVRCQVRWQKGLK